MYQANGWRSVLWAARVAIVNVAVVAAILLWLPFSLPVRAIAVVAVVALAIAVFPKRYVGSAIRVGADGIESLTRNGKVERMGWDEITHFHPAPLFLRLADFRQRPVFKGYVWPLLTNQRRAVVDAIRQHAPQAVEVSSLGWWKTVLRHARS